MSKNILITGKPKSGKSTLIKEVINDIQNRVGIVTSEIIWEHERVGFEIETYTEHKIVLAHTDFTTPKKVSKYYVDVKNLESVLPEVSVFKNDDLLYLDEIGEMQLFSEEFKKLVLYYLDSQNTCLATISSVFEDDFIRSILKRDDVVLIEISPENRKEKKDLISQMLKN